MFICRRNCIPFFCWYFHVTCLYNFLLLLEYQGASSSENVNSWKWRLNSLLRDKDKQELISREKKDRRDFEQIEALASRMGLYRYILCGFYSTPLFLII